MELVDSKDIEFSTPEELHKVMEEHAQENGLIDLCDCNYLSIAKDSKSWGVKHLTEIKKYFSYYKPENDSIHISFMDNKSPNIGCIEIFKYKHFKNLKKQIKNNSISYTLFEKE